jgi:hypothetical protein
MYPNAYPNQNPDANASQPEPGPASPSTKRPLIQLADHQPHHEIDRDHHALVG